MQIDVDKIELVALDPKKCNVILIHLPEGARSDEYDQAMMCAEHLCDLGVKAAMVVPPKWRIAFAEQEPKDEIEATFSSYPQLSDNSAKSA